MSLYVDKYRPKTLDSLSYHDDLTSRLRALASTDFPHTLFYGQSGAGKKTRIMAVLQYLYGPGVEKLRVEQRVFMTPSRRKLEFNIIQSNYHIELTPSDLGNSDRLIIQDILKEIAQSQQVDLNAKKRFKVVIINEADLLTRDAQSALRRTMEKYSANLRMILCANSTSKIIAPIRSRCLLLRVGAPSEDEMVSVMLEVAHKQKFMLPKHVATVLARASRGNLRLALLSLEALQATDPVFVSVPPSAVNVIEDVASSRDLDVVPRPDWETFAYRAAERVLKGSSPEALLDVRSMMYELLVHCIPASTILTTMTRRMLDRVDPSVQDDVIHWAAFYEHRLRQGSKAIFHLEAFAAKIMSVMKRACPC